MALKRKEIYEIPNNMIHLLWKDELGKDDLVFFPASKRTGVLHCKQTGGPVLYSGDQC